MFHLSRRDWLRLSTAAVLAAPVSARANADVSDETLPVAGVVTVYRRNSHADVILGKILEGYQQDGGPGPKLKLVSLYVDQTSAGDLSGALAEKHGFRLAKTIDEAITLGTDHLKVAGVISIGEHGDYPSTPDTKQHMYPRRKFFDAIVAAFQRCGKVVPVFNDKHLSYRWDDALHMVQTARRLKIPFLAGSSVPVAWREPALDLPMEAEVESALTIGYGGFESYGFHAIEGHQCMIERRRGGETGIESVEVVQGAGILDAEKRGDWSRELLDAALANVPARLKRSQDWLPKENSAAYLLRHRDGLRSSVLMANGLTAHLGFAAKLKGRAEPLAVWLKLQDDRPYGHFAYLLRAIDHTIRTGRVAYPVERTLLTTGILDRVMQSLAQQGKKLPTPELDVSYRAADWPFANRNDSPLKLPSE